MVKLGRPGYPLRFEYTEEGCKVPVGFKLNQDGYFRKRIDGKLIMYHRYSYEQEHGDIPEGMEVDHLCKNRACCNVEHLQLLTSSEHRSKDNMGRYEDKRDEAKRLVNEHPEKSMVWIADQIDMSHSAVTKWKRKGVF